jgi:hypothetical protein
MAKAVGIVQTALSKTSASYIKVTILGDSIGDSITIL